MSESKFPLLPPHELLKIPTNFDSACGNDSGSLWKKYQFKENYNEILNVCSNSAPLKQWCSPRGACYVIRFVNF